MADEAHQAVDKMIEEMQKKISGEYKKAVETAQKRLDDHLKKYAELDAKWKAKVDAGKATKKDWNKWRKEMMMNGKHWEQMRDTLAQDYHNANVIARSIVTGYMPEAYATNYNWATYTVEKGLNIDTSFTLYNREAVERIAKEDPEILPPPGPTMQAKIAANKDLAWQQGQIQSVTLRSILTGESIDKIAKTISQELGAENFAAATRYARTAMTGAQNAGRQDAFERAESLGIEMQREWVATLDDKTRHEHRMLDGQRVGVNEPFEVDGEKIMYPGDPSAAGYLVWNCRCTVVSQLKGFERDINVENAEYMKDMTYEEWKHAKAPQNPKLSAKEITSQTIDRDTKIDQAIEEASRRTYGTYAQKYEAATDQNEIPLIEAKGPAKQREIVQTGSFSVPSNDTENAVAYIAPSGAKSFLASDETKNTILSDGRLALNAYSGNNDTRRRCADMINNELYTLAGVRKPGVFYRVIGSDKEIDYIKNGTIRASINHMTGEKEDGLSVWEIPKYGGGKIVALRGDVISLGSDKEPILDLKTIEYIGVYDNDPDIREKGKELFSDRYGWTRQQIDDALLGKIQIKR